MADPDQFALIKRSVLEWKKWREAHRDVKVDLNGADFNGADLSYSYFSGIYHVYIGADLSFADLSNANLSRADLSFADLREANLSNANLSNADLNEADLSNANLSNANFEGTDLTNVHGFHSPTPSKPQSSQSSSTTNWLSMVEAFGSNLLVAAATLASIIQGLDVIERRWREKKEKQKQQSAQVQSSSTQSAVSSSHKTPGPDGEIIEIRLVMDDGSPHSFKRWISDPDELRTYIDAFSDPTSKVKPLQVTFMKREGRSLVVDITKGGKDNPQLNVILGYLEAE